MSEKTLLKRLKSMGPLRNMLHILALVFMLLMPFASLPGHTSEFDLFLGGILPAATPLVIIVLMLDVMMSKIWKDGAPPERVAELNFIIRTHLIVALALLLAFLTVFLPVLIR